MCRLPHRHLDLLHRRPLLDDTPQPCLTPESEFWMAGCSYANEMAANLSVFWAQGAITVDTDGRLLLPDTMPRIHPVSAYGYGYY